MAVNKIITKNAKGILNGSMSTISQSSNYYWTTTVLANEIKLCDGTIYANGTTCVLGPRSNYNNVPYTGILKTSAFVFATSSFTQTGETNDQAYAICYDVVLPTEDSYQPTGIINQGSGGDISVSIIEGPIQLKKTFTITNASQTDQIINNIKVFRGITDITNYPTTFKGVLVLIYTFDNITLPPNGAATIVLEV